MAPFIVVLGTQIYIIKIRSLKLISKDIAQKVKTKFGYYVDFMTLNILKLEFFHIS